MNRTLHSMVSTQCQQRPELAALVHQNFATSYGQLEEQSNRLAWLLRDAGCRDGDRVGILLPKSTNAIVSILATLKADCIYVPLDPACPVSRLEHILQSCSFKCILTGGLPRFDYAGLRSAFPDQVAVGWLDEPAAAPADLAPTFDAADIQSAPTVARTSTRKPDDIAHILFTSGSTGRPKGVPITHANVAGFLDWACPYFDIAPGDRNSGVPPLHFDLSTFDIFGTLSSGASLYLVTPEMTLAPQRLVEFIRRAELTQWFSVPSLLTYLARFDAVKDRDFPALRRLLWCGEACSVSTLRYWMARLPHVTFTNLYGPTETTIASSYYRMPGCPRDDSERIPIGAACAGEGLLILDDDLKPVAPDEIGDLYIRGTGLSPGYWQDPEKTRAAFLTDPSAGNPQERIYRTGDLASTDAAGLYYLHGRKDSQIKSRGYRIELGEIETVLRATGAVADCAVVAFESPRFDGATIACAYVSPADRSAAAADLKSRLTAALPAYMVPARWMEFAELPLNPNGKVDRPFLRERFARQDSPARTLSAGGME